MKDQKEQTVIQTFPRKIESKSAQIFFLKSHRHKNVNKFGISARTALASRQTLFCRQSYMQTRENIISPDPTK